MRANRAIASERHRASMSPRMRWHESLADGTPVLIRRIRKGDERIENEFLQRLSESSRHDCFPAVVRSPIQGFDQRLKSVGNGDDVGFIAVIRPSTQDVVIGAGSYIRSDDGKSCHCAVAIDEQWRKRGLGTLLMVHLIDEARANGVLRMYAVDAVGCEKTHQLAGRLGFRCRPDPEDPVSTTYELLL